MIYAHILVMALVTYLIRMLPLVLVKKRIRSPLIQSFLYYIPYTILAAMAFPAIFYSTSSGISATVGLVMAVVFSYFGKSLLIVAVSSCMGVLVAELVMYLLP